MTPDRPNEFLDALRTVLQKKGVAAWQIRWAHRQSFQSFLALDRLEARREADAENAVVTVHAPRVDQGRPVLGLSSFKVSPQSVADAEHRVDQALYAASLVSNEPFELPGPADAYPTADIADPSVGPSLLPAFEDRLRAAVAREKHVRLSSAEFFVDRIASRLLNHRGVDISQEETVLHAELILLARDGDRENEYIDRFTRRRTADFDLEREASASARFARDASRATLPKTGRFTVVLSEEPLDHLFNPLVARASARLKYNRMVESDLGKSILDGEPSGDRITIWSNGLLDGALGSARFDAYGSPSQRVRLIADNRLERYVADQRYGSYLRVPVTGELANVEVEAGSMPFDRLLDPASAENGTVYLLQAFSAFEPNAITGAFSAEIRAGYEITASGTRPIKGGSVAGVLQRDLRDCRLSSERELRENALVPRGVRFQALTLAGA